MQLRFIEWRLTLGSIRKKADDKNVTNALSKAEKVIDELKRLIAIAETSIATAEKRLNTGDIPFKE